MALVEGVLSCVAECKVALDSSVLVASLGVACRKSRFEVVRALIVSGAMDPVAGMKCVLNFGNNEHLKLALSEGWALPWNALLLVCVAAVFCTVFCSSCISV